MAKKGLVYYLSFGSGIIATAYLFYANSRKTKAEDIEKMYLDPVTNKRPPTANEIRLMGERNKVSSVPISDKTEGYM